jgi:hypothetical protein
LKPFQEFEEFCQIENWKKNKKMLNLIMEENIFKFKNSLNFAIRNRKGI